MTWLPVRSTFESAGSFLWPPRRRASPWAAPQSKKCGTSSCRLFEKPGSSWPPSRSTWMSTATRLAGCTLSAPSASPRLLAAQLGTGAGPVQLGARRSQRRESFSRASARPRDAARQPWGSFFVSFPGRSPTPALAVGPKLLGVGPPRSFRSSRAPGRWSLASSACTLQRGTGSGRFGCTAS